MSLDFPASPVEGQTYAAEGAMYRYISGRWVVLSQNEALTAIFGGDVAAGWSVFGDTLIQWGTASVPPAGLALAFPRDFAAAPNITGSVHSASAIFITVGNRAPTGCDLNAFQDDGTAPGIGVGVSWIAIGEALDADKTPKILAGADAAQALAPYMMHGDVTAGWWVTGDKLECWGFGVPNVNGHVSIVFPREFGSIPRVTAMTRTSSSSQTIARVVMENSTATATTTGVGLVVRRIDDGGAVTGTDTGFQWYAIGEAMDADKRPQ